MVGAKAASAPMFAGQVLKFFSSGCSWCWSPALCGTGEVITLLLTGDSAGPELRLMKRSPRWLLTWLLWWLPMWLRSSSVHGFSGCFGARDAGTTPAKSFEMPFVLRLEEEAAALWCDDDDSHEVGEIGDDASFIFLSLPRFALLVMPVADLWWIARSLRNWSSSTPFTLPIDAERVAYVAEEAATSRLSWLNGVVMLFLRPRFVSDVAGTDKVPEFDCDGEKCFIAGPRVKSPGDDMNWRLSLLIR
mmetsp:Transcript_75236/g.220332  ORF Transcript_75236/g.220332 Transcript_75236/m.220332 type:complete len:247 (+) Transcript_75236:301-1041(+)